ncbi:hypothetical protein EYF80_007057 [Liparis tanakae]|uniref:Uncharacterized protein n=1 Tax=Liparis tanakae TaxID=230148 RepID=A0A4Z2IX22_9TELE|nr:hypothetical protein EYF80_007057 [Liparis tanakae]
MNGSVRLGTCGEVKRRLLSASPRGIWAVRWVLGGAAGGEGGGVARIGSLMSQNTQPTLEGSSYH